MNWEMIVETFNTWCNAVKDFFNQPVPIIGCTIGFLLITFLSILSKTSWGRKTINTVIGSINTLKAETTAKISETSENINNLKNEYEQKLAIAETHSQELETLLLNIGDQLHNKQIKEYVEKYRQTKQDAKTQVQNLVEQSSKAIELKMEEMQKQMDSYKNELAKQYQEMIENYEKELKELQEKVENKKELMSDGTTQANE